LQRSHADTIGLQRIRFRILPEPDRISFPECD
jgi:hypothetical protein